MVANSDVHEDIEKILLTEEMIQAKVKRTGGTDHRKVPVAGRPLQVIVILKGAAFFAADLLRRI